MRIGGEASKKCSMTSNGLWHLLEIFLEGRSVSIPFPSSKTKEPGKNGKMSQWCLLKERFITRFTKVRAAEVYFARFDICFVNLSALGTAIVEEERQVTSGGIDFVVDGEFCASKPVGPVVLAGAIEDAKILFHFLIELFSLAIHFEDDKL